MSVTSDEILSPRSRWSEAEEVEPLSVSEVVRRYHHLLMAVLRRRLPVAEDAADIAQEAYIRLLQYEGSRNIRSPLNLLVRIAINLTKDHRRYQRLRRVAEQCRIDDLEIASNHPSQERELSALQELEMAIAAIEELPPRCKQVFLLSRASHMSYPEIAEHCGVSVKMVEKHISHALAFMSRTREEREGKKMAGRVRSEALVYLGVSCRDGSRRTSHNG